MFNDSLNFEPSLEKLAYQTSPFHVLLSGFLRKSRTFELYETIARSENLHCRLLPFELSSDDVQRSASQLSALLNLLRTNSNFQSILVSDPFKHQVHKYSDRIAESAVACGAINVLFKNTLGNDAEIIGENFDGFAFQLGAEQHEGITFNDKSMLFFGCGGVSSAVAVRLSNKLSRVALVDLDDGRTEKLELLLSKANPNLSVERLSCSGSRDFRGFDYVYNGTGLGKHNLLSPLRSEDLFNQTGIAFDANYTPAKTEFLKQMEDRKWRIVNGLSHMLSCTAAHLGHVLPGRVSVTGETTPAVDYAVVRSAFEKMTY